MPNRPAKNNNNLSLKIIIETNRIFGRNGSLPIIKPSSIDPSCARLSRGTETEMEMEIERERERGAYHWPFEARFTDRFVRHPSTSSFIISNYCYRATSTPLTRSIIFARNSVIIFLVSLDLIDRGGWKGREKKISIDCSLLEQNDISVIENNISRLSNLALQIV